MTESRPLDVTRKDGVLVPKQRSYMPRVGVCTIAGCGKAIRARGMCHKHYMRWWEHGDAKVVKKVQSPSGAPEAFYRMAIAYEGDECLIWPFSRNNVGYAQIYTGEGKKSLVHRRVCSAKNGPPPTPQHQAAHRCGNGHRGCITPRHLRWATPMQNSADMVAHGRSTRGESSASARLTSDQVKNIRGRLNRGVSQSSIAQMFGVSNSTIRKIATGETWSWLTGISR